MNQIQFLPTTFRMHLRFILPNAIFCSTVIDAKRRFNGQKLQPANALVEQTDATVLVSFLKRKGNGMRCAFNDANTNGDQTAFT